LQDFAFGVLAAPGESTRFKSEGKPPSLATVALLSESAPPSFDADVARGTALARGTLFARYLVESPPNVCSPVRFAFAQHIPQECSACAVCSLHGGVAAKSLQPGALH
jgi:leucyl aminopeptidase